MPGRSFRIATVAGIPIGVSPWWLAIVALLTAALGGGYFPDVVPGLPTAAGYALGLASALLLFGSILLHELGHALVARREGVQVVGIDLWLLGGVARMHGEAREPRGELRYAAAGPAVTAVVASTFGLLSLLLPASRSSVIGALIQYQAVANLLILGFNLLPAYPLDGGRVVHALLWRRHGDLERATTTAATIGRGCGWAMVALGLLELAAGGPAGLWLALVGWFVAIAADAQRRAAAIEHRLRGVPVAALMTHPAVAVPGAVTVGDAIGEFFVGAGRRAFPVVDQRWRTTGVVTSTAVAGAARDRRVAELADDDPALLVDAGLDVVALLERPAFSRVGCAVVVDERRHPLGVVTISDVQRALWESSSGRRGAGDDAPTRPRPTPR
ncbi:site-2 protease family protein [Patulibacter defluvii]|uniref:site-2 protease family protein n=1 Tax=Patulibacter defluvii TaxID=3095358 RepID=UPI002A760215|nr:site-2 protease family protein [Patulibacter sp. DM4]